MTLPWLEKKLEYFKTDDVFSNSFLTTILLITDQGSTDFKSEIATFFSSQGCKALYIARSGSISWAEGPYFYSSRGLFAAWRLYPDSGETFIAATVPSQTDNTT
jgi:hypothetical protein